MNRTSILTSLMLLGLIGGLSVCNRSSVADGGSPGVKLRFYEPSLLQKLLKGEQLRSVASSLNGGRPGDVREVAASL